MDKADKIVKFIFAKDCPDCQEMLETIRRAIEAIKEHYKSEYKIIWLDSETNEAVKEAVASNINDLPGCVIGNKSFYGKKGYKYLDLYKAMEEQEKNE